MLSDNKQKAAIAGVLYYLQMEQEHKIVPAALKTFPTPWQLTGRTTIMQMRGLVQRRVLKRH
ncbi:MAG: hypothetical protein JXJ04_10890 [Spirochaetales bacterium]|nr:hypothetical protein [Spirochaetales bacterium]